MTQKKKVTGRKSLKKEEAVKGLTLETQKITNLPLLKDAI